MKYNLSLGLEASKQSKGCGRIFRSGFEFILEMIALADLITDVQVLLMLVKTDHIAWTTITFFSMFAPFYASQIPYMTFLK